MAGLSADRPSEVVLAARVARQFYLEGVSKVDIADRLGISRFRVARLLDCAREAGMVHIEIGLPGGSLDAGLSAELCSAFGLEQAFVFNFPDDEQALLRRRLGEAAGQTPAWSSGSETPYSGRPHPAGRPPTRCWPTCPPSVSTAPPASWPSARPPRC